MLRLAAFLIFCAFLQEMHPQFSGPYAVRSIEATGEVTEPSHALVRYFGAYHMAGLGGAGVEVNCMLVDDQDTYWLGTSSGLVRLDGDRWSRSVHRPGTDSSLPNDHVTALTVDGQGRLWVGTWGGICRSDARSGTFERVQLGAAGADAIRSGQVVHLRYAHGKIWCLTWESLCVIDPGTNEIQQVITTARVDRSPRRDGIFITGLAFPADGGDPVISTTQGILMVDPYTLRTRPFHGADLPEGIVRLFPSSGGRIWGHDPEKGLVFLLDSLAGVVRTVSQPDDPSGNRIFRAAYEDVRGTVWSSGINGDVHVMEPRTGRSTRLDLRSLPTGVSGATYVKTFHEDRLGRLWLGGDAGVMVLVPAHEGLNMVEVPDLGVGHKIISMLQDPAGPVLLGTHSDGIRYWDHEQDNWHTVRDESFAAGTREYRVHNTIFACVPAGKARYVVATMAGPALLVNGRSLVRLPVEDPLLARSAVVAATFGPDGHLWLGTMKSGVFEVDTSSWHTVRHFTYEDSVHHLPGHTIGALHHDGRGTIWAGLTSDPGLVRLLPGMDRFEAVPASDGQPVGEVFSIDTGTEGVVMAGTSYHGVLLYHEADQRTTRITLANGAPGNRIKGVVSHPALGMWFGAVEGIARISLEDARALPVAVCLSKDNFSGRLALDVTSRRLWIGDGGRLLYLQLNEEPLNPATPRVAVLDVRVNGISWDPMRPLQLNAAKDQLAFAVSVQDPINASAIRIAYRLAPTMDWEECTGCGEIVYAELPVGDHFLELRAMDPQGRWGEVTTYGEIQVSPPFWRTWWFRSILLLAFLGVIAGVFQWRLSRRTMALNARFEYERGLSEERLRIANDLHDELGSGLSVIKVKSQLSLERPERHPPAETLSQIADSSTELIHGMRQMIWAIRSGQSSLADLVAYMRSYASEYMQDHGINCSFVAPANLQEVQLSVEQRRALLLIMKEALHNVVKHAEAQNVAIIIQHDRKLRMMIKDDGQGSANAPAAGLEAGIGVASMHQRAAAMGGTLKVERDAGTTVLVELGI